jgi:hypothetical protein
VYPNGVNACPLIAQRNTRCNRFTLLTDIEQ